MGIRMSGLTMKAYAKINLGLDVVRRLENGYHEVKMVMQTVGIADVLTFFVTVPFLFPFLRQLVRMDEAEAAKV